VQDIAGGIVLMLVAALALYFSRDLPAAGRVGLAAGTAPRLFSWVLMGIGAFIAVSGFLKEGDGFGKVAWRGLFTILGSVLFFALAIRDFGLAITGVPMIMIASFATPDFRWKEAIVFGLAITAFCALIFPYALGQPIPLWPTF